MMNGIKNVTYNGIAEVYERGIPCYTLTEPSVQKWNEWAYKSYICYLTDKLGRKPTTQEVEDLRVELKERR